MELFKILLFNKNRFANNAFCVFVAIKIAVCNECLHQRLSIVLELAFLISVRSQGALSQCFMSCFMLFSDIFGK